MYKLIFMQTENEEIIPRPMMVIDPNLSFELEEEADTTPSHTINLQNQPNQFNSLKKKTPFVPNPTEDLPPEILHLKLLENLNITEQEIISAMNTDSFQEIGSLINISPKNFLICPETNLLLNLENLVFIRSLKNHAVFWLLGEVEDVFGNIEDPVYKIKQNSFLSKIHSELSLDLKVYAIQAKIDKITDEDIHRMKREKKSDASGQYDQEIDQGYIDTNEISFENDDEEEEQQKQDQLNNPLLGGMFQKRNQMFGNRVEMNFRSKKIKQEPQSNNLIMVPGLGYIDPKNIIPHNSFN